MALDHDTYIVATSAEIGALKAKVDHCLEQIKESRREEAERHAENRMIHRKIDGIEDTVSRLVAQMQRIEEKLDAAAKVKAEPAAQSIDFWAYVRVSAITAIVVIVVLRSLNMLRFDLLAGAM